MSELGDIVAAGLGFRRADDFTDWLARERNDALMETVAASAPKKPHLRKADIRALIEDAERSGKRVSAVTVNGATLNFAEAEKTATLTPLEAWKAKHARPA
jgi:hypothetical protein